ncbi:MAG TPA: cyclase family protein [Thermomicrobiales bacterium]|nr:cyclase family protein [Thermomicrobiales bacterium]
MFAGRRIYDISAPLVPGLPVWPGDPATEVAPVLRVARGEGANVSRLTLGTHTGTHCDPPRHFFDAGAPAGALALETLIGPAAVLDLTHCSGIITAAELDAARIPPTATRLLFKTRTAPWWTANDGVFDPDFTGLSLDGARWLVAHGIRLVGIDTLSIERFDAPPGEPVHIALLTAGIVILEGLDLSQIAAGDYTLIFLPLKLHEGDGGPGRAVLIED